MTSVVIAAYNESTVIGRTLDTLLAGASDGELDVTVVANGCTDDTPHGAARRRGVRVVELAHGNKPRALDAGDAVAHGFPRVYLDADIPVAVDVIRTLCAALTAAPDPGAEPPVARFPAGSSTRGVVLSSCVPTRRFTGATPPSMTGCSAEA